MNRNPLHPRPKRWPARLNPMCVFLCRPLRRWWGQRKQGLVEVEVRGVEHLITSLQAAAGILITPNHPGHADAYAIYEAADRARTSFYVMSAWQVFDQNTIVGRWLMQRHGCFSVDREGADREAFKTAIEILREKHQPLVIFPEGEVYHQNDRVTPFREGATAIAVSAAKKAKRPIVCLPCAIKYRYLTDPTPALLELMDRIEEKILWRPRRDLSLVERIYRVAEGLLALKEIEYLDDAQAGPLPQRVSNLADTILRNLESRYGIAQKEGEGDAQRGSVPERVKALRAAALKRMQAMDESTSMIDRSSEADGDNESQREQIARDLDDLFLVVQLFSYPGDYVAANPSLERIAETLDKLEEDVLGVESATIRAPRRAIVSIGEPIPVGGGDTPHPPVDPTTLRQSLESGVQRLLDAI